MIDIAAPPSAHNAIVQRVAIRLRRSSYYALNNVEVSEQEGTVVLSGRLPNYFLKQIAQCLAASVEGVVRVENRTIVDSN